MFSQELKAKLNVSLIRKNNKMRIEESWASVANVEAMLMSHEQKTNIAYDSANVASSGAGGYSYTKTVTTTSKNTRNYKTET